MIVCHCFDITDREIINAFKSSLDWEDFCANCKAGSGCGVCSIVVWDIFEKIKAEEKQNEIQYDKEARF